MTSVPKWSDAEDIAPSWDNAEDIQAKPTVSPAIADLQARIAEQAAPVEAGGAGESTALGAANVGGLAKTLAPASAVAEKVATNLFGDEEMKRQVNKQSVPQLANETVGLLEEDRARHPAATLFGQALPLMAVNPVAGAAATYGTRAAEGAILGASGGDTLSQRASGAAIGAATGGALRSIEDLPRIGAALKDAAGAMSVRLLKFSGKQIENMGPSKLQKLGQFLVDQGYTKGPAMLKTVAEKVSLEIADLGQRLGRMYAGVTEKTSTVPLKSVINDVSQRLQANGGFSKASDMTTAVDALVDFGSKNGAESASIDDLWKMARNMESEAKVFSAPGRATATEGSKADILRQTARALREHIADRAAQFAPGEAAIIKETNASFNLIADADHQLSKYAVIDKYTPAKSSETLYGDLKSALLGGTPTKTAAISLADKLGAAVQKNAALLGPWMPKLSRAATLGNATLAQEFFRLSQSDPEFRQAWSEAQNGE
jgi:hypothetical protein